MSVALPRALVTLGETMALFRPGAIGPGELVDAYHLASGGAESNVAIGVTRLGGRAVWIGRVGEDAPGRKVVRDLRAEGVEARVIVDRTASTGVMTKESRTPGRTAVHYARTGSAGSRLRADDLDHELIAAAGILHLTGITPSLSPSAAEAVEAAARAAQQAGVPISFDINHRPSLWRGRDARATYVRLAAQATIVFAGEDEAAMVVGPARADDLARRISALGPATVVIKRGAEGAWALHEGRSVSIAAVPISPVDTVGAGDAFVAGYLAELLRGGDLHERLRTAVRAGAFACLCPGDWEGFPRSHELDLLDAAEPVVR